MSANTEIAKALEVLVARLDKLEAAKPTPAATVTATPKARVAELLLPHRNVLDGRPGGLSHAVRINWTGKGIAVQHTDKAGSVAGQQRTYEPGVVIPKGTGRVVQARELVTDLLVHKVDVSVVAG